MKSLPTWAEIEKEIGRRVPNGCHACNEDSCETIIEWRKNFTSLFRELLLSELTGMEEVVRDLEAKNKQHPIYISARFGSSVEDASDIYQLALTDILSFLSTRRKELEGNK